MRKEHVYSILFTAFLIRLFFLPPTYSDENIYFNMAKNMAERNLVPYKDFFYAHPPLHLFLLFILFKLFGSSLYLGKLLPLTCVFLSSFLIFKVYHLFFKKEDFLLPILFFFSPQVLSFGAIGYGMWPPLTLSLLSILFFLKKKPLFSAFSLTLACFFRYLFLLYLPVFMVLFYRKKELKKFILSFVFIFSSLSLLFFLTFGQSFLSQTVLYHVESKMSEFKNPAFYSHYLTMNLPLLFISSLTFLLFGRKKRMLYTAISLDAFILFFFKVGFAHYFLLSFPFYLFVLPSFDYKDVLYVFFVLYVLLNYPSILYHNTTNQVVDSILNYFEGKQGEVFGDSILMNLVSFKHGLRVPFDEFDADPIRMKLNSNVLEMVREEGTDYLVLSEFSPSEFFFPGYTQELSLEGLPDVWVFHKI